MYESEFTRFMRDWMEKHPEQKQEQQKGRALWWDKPQELAAQKAFRGGTVPQKPYPYQAD